MAEVTEEEIKAFAIKYAPALAKNITRLVGQVIEKGLAGVICHAAELKLQVIALEAALATKDAEIARLRDPR
jgi:hypothetical protein